MPQLMFGTCQVPGCNRSHKARGYCPAHYQQYLRGVPIKAAIREKLMDPPLICTEPGCGAPEKSRGLCAMHYARLLRHGHTKYRDRKKPAKICSEPGCDNHMYAKGVCHQHYIRRRGMAAKYGITVDAYLAMMESQGGRCAICQAETSRTDW